jgi:hypothetical protein
MLGSQLNSDIGIDKVIKEERKRMHQPLPLAEYEIWIEEKNTLHKEHTYIQIQLWSSNVWMRGEYRIRMMAEKEANTIGEILDDSAKINKGIVRNSNN